MVAIIHGELPPREVLLRFIADHPQQASKRELAKAFGLKGESRVALKELLRELEEEGMVQKSRKSLIRPGALPPIAVLERRCCPVSGSVVQAAVPTSRAASAAPTAILERKSIMLPLGLPGGRPPHAATCSAFVMNRR